MSHPPTLNKRLILVVLLSLLGHATAADTSAEECELADPTLYLWDAKQLSNLKKKYQSGDASSVFKSSLSFLERECAEALDGETYSVTYQKRVPESGDIHDYQSVGYYWWPCAEAEHEGFNNCVQKTKTGTEPKECVDDAKWGSIPWRYCDGHHNAATFEYSSKESMQQMTNQVRDLALLWYYTEKDQYARIASQLLQVFFLDEDTRMNPMLQYAQFVPDLWYFESAGLIEITGWTELLEAVAILRTSQHWSNAHHRQLMDWMYELMEWLQTSRMGEKEHYAGNNHAVWYYQTVIGMGLHVTEVHPEALVFTHQLISEVGELLIADQITPDGVPYKEVERSRATHYVCYTLTPYMRVVTMATRDPTAERIDSTHMDRLKKAVQWTFPYMTRAEEFPYDDVDVNRGNKGDMWQRCIEQAVITIATWNGSTFADDARAAVRAQRDAYCIEPDSYGAPVVLVMEAAYDEFGDSNCF